jgi:hypothetical protein
LKGVVQRLEVEMRGLKAQESVLRREVEEVGRLEGVVERTAGENEVLKGRLSESEKENETLNERLSESKKEVGRLQEIAQTLPDLSTIIPPTDFEITTLFNESLDNLNTLMAQILDSDAVGEALDRNLSLLLQQLKGWLSTHESTLYTLLTEVKARESVIPDLEFRIADLRAENEGLYARLKAKDEKKVVKERKVTKRGEKKAVGMRELNGLGDIPIVERSRRVTRGRPNYDEGHRKSVVSVISEGFVDESEGVKEEVVKADEGDEIVGGGKGVVTGRVTKKKTAATTKKGKRKGLKDLDPNFVFDLTAEVEDELLRDSPPEEIPEEQVGEQDKPAINVTKKKPTAITTKKGKRKGAKILDPNFKIDTKAETEEEDDILEADIINEDLEVVNPVPKVKRGRKRKAKVLDPSFVDKGGEVDEEEEVLPL